MSESFEDLSQEVSEAEISGKTETVAATCRRALDSPTVQSSAERMFHFGMKLAALLLGGDEPIRDEDVSEGIFVLRKLLTFVSPVKNPAEYASTHLQLGSALFREERNLRSAISHFEEALLFLRQERSPREWALAKVAAGQAYWWLDHRRERVVAIRYLEEALAYFTLEKFPEDYEEYSEQLTSWKKVVPP